MRSLIVFFSLLVSGASFSQVTYLTENFDIPAGQALTNHGWYAHSQNGVDPVLSTNGGLSWNTYYGSGIGNAAAVINNNEDVNKPLSPFATEGAVYTSFLVHVDAPFPVDGEGVFFHLGFYGSFATPVPNATFGNINTGFRGRTFIQQGTNSSTQFRLGLSFNAANAQGYTGDLNIGQTYLVVVKYDIVPGADNDNVSLFVFAEGDLAAYEPSTPTLGPFSRTASAADAPAIQAVGLRQFSSDQNITVDGIIVKDHWDIALTTLLVENFDYPAGNPLTDHGWNAHSAPNTNPILVSNNGLIFPTYAANAVGRAAAVTNTGQDINKQLSEDATSGAVYASFMVHVDAPFDADGQGFFFHFGRYSNMSNPVLTSLSPAFRARTHVLHGTNPNTQFKRGISLNAALPSAESGDLNIGQTYVVVVKYQFVQGDLNDLVSMYIFEQGDDLTTEPATPSVGPVTNTPIDPLDPMSPLAPDAPAIQAAVLRQYDANQNILVDGLIVRNHWNIFVPCVTAQGVDEISSCEPIVWIDGNTYSSSNNSATFLISGGAFNGCDSLVTLNLTITQCTQLASNFCGATNVTMDMPLRAINVNAPEYRFRITGANNGGPGWNSNSFVHDSPNRAFKFAFIPGSIWGETYGVEVAVGDGLGNFGLYGASCDVTLIGLPTTQLEAADCGATGVDPSTNLLAIKVTGSTGYRFQVNGPGVAANTVVGKTMGGGAMRKLKMNEVAGILQGEIYTVEVAIRDAAGNWGAYGTACNVTLFGTPELVINNDGEIFIDNKTTTLVEFGANASHNPFTTEFGLQVLNANDQEPIAISIYDMSGKLIERHAVNPMDVENAKFGSNLASGMYMIEVRQGSNQAIIRQVKN